MSDAGVSSVARPLVVIDPEDREQVERLVNALLAILGDSILPNGVTEAQSALRSLLEPERPEEPTGRYAIAIADGVAWCRAAWANDRPWNRLGTDLFANWDDMDVTSIEFEGVPA